MLVEKEKMGGGVGRERGEEEKKKRKKNKGKMGINQHSLSRLPASQTWGISHSEINGRTEGRSTKRTEGTDKEGSIALPGPGTLQEQPQFSQCPKLGLKLAEAFSLLKNEESLGSRLWGEERNISDGKEGRGVPGRCPQ